MKYDYKKTLMKVAVGAGYALVTGLIVWKTEDPAWVMLIPFLMGMQNVLKHKYGIL